MLEREKKEERRKKKKKKEESQVVETNSSLTLLADGIVKVRSRAREPRHRHFTVNQP